MAGGARQPNGGELVVSVDAPEASRGLTSQGEFQPLTVLMCDIENSTALTRTLGDDAADLVRGEYYDFCSEIANRHGGHVEQFLGDGVLIYFGYPRANEDDAHCAIRCGLEIINGIGGLKLPAKLGASKLRVRLGIHSGYTVVGTKRTGNNVEHPATAVTTLAERIQACTAADTLAITDATWRMVQPFFTAESLGRHDLKNVGFVQLWRVIGPSGAATRFEGVGPLTPYVGREAEHRSLDWYWRAVEGRISRFVLLRGEAGIGKSRLVHEFRQGLSNADIDILEMRCTRDTQGSALWPVIDLIGRRLGLDRSLPSNERLARIETRMEEIRLTAPDALPLLAELLSLRQYPDLPMSPQRRRARTLEILVKAVEALASQKKTILIVEDLHWADPSSVELLEILVSSAPQLPLLGLFTARPEFEPAWLPATGGATPGAAVIEMSRLDPVAVETMARSIAHGKNLPSEVLGEIVRLGYGVPLFIEEVTRTVIESGVVKERGTSWELTGPLPVGLVPDSLRPALKARLDRLGEAKSTAVLAAAIGREVPYELIAAVSNRPEQVLRGQLKSIVDASLMTREGAGASERYIFKHAMIRDAAYDSMRGATKEDAHGRIARELDSNKIFSGIKEEQPELIAHHFMQAGDDKEALKYWTLAAQRARTRTAMKEGRAFLEHAMDALSRLPRDGISLRQEMRLQSMMAPVIMTVEGWGSPLVRTACERARNIARDLINPDKPDLELSQTVYGATWGIWSSHFVRGELADALRVANEARAMADDSGVPMIQMNSHHAKSYTHLYRGEFEDTLREADAGLGLFNLEQERALAKMFELSSAVCLHATRATSLWMLGRVEESKAERKRMLEIGRDLGHAPSRAAALAFDLYVGLTAGWGPVEIHQRIAIAEELLKLSKDEDFKLWHAQAMAFRGAAAAFENGALDCNSQMNEGVEECIRTGARVTLVGMEVMCAQAEFHRGDLDRASNWLDRAQAEADTRNERMWEPEIDRVHALICRRRNDVAGEESALRRAQAKAHAQQAHSLELRAAVDLSDLLDRTGRKDEARRVVKSAVVPFDGLSRDPEVSHARALVSA
jgi:predicted ATPase/class 3 adenylate cyclase